MGNVQDHNNHQSSDDANRNISKSVPPLRAKESYSKVQKSNQMSNPEAFNIYQTRKVSSIHDSSSENGSFSDETFTLPDNDTFTKENLPELVNKLDEISLSTPKKKTNTDNKLINQVFNKVPVDQVDMILKDCTNEVMNAINENDNTLDNLSDFTNTFETVQENSVQSSTFNSINDSLRRESLETQNPVDCSNVTKNVTMHNEIDSSDSEISLNTINQSSSATTSTSTENSLEGHLLITNFNNTSLNPSPLSKKIDEVDLITNVKNNNVNLQYNVIDTSNDNFSINYKTTDNVPAIDLTRNLINNNVLNNECQLENILSNNINIMTDSIKNNQDHLVSDTNTLNTSVTDVQCNKSNLESKQNNSNEYLNDNTLKSQSSFSNFVEQLNNKQTTLLESTEANSTPNVSSNICESSILISRKNDFEEKPNTSVSLSLNDSVNTSSKLLSENITEDNLSKNTNLNWACNFTPLNEVSTSSNVSVINESLKNKLPGLTNNIVIHQDLIAISVSPKKEINTNVSSYEKNSENGTKPTEIVLEKSDLSICTKNVDKQIYSKEISPLEEVQLNTEINITDNINEKNTNTSQEKIVSNGSTQLELEYMENCYEESKKNVPVDTQQFELNKSEVIFSNNDAKILSHLENDTFENKVTLTNVQNDLVGNKEDTVVNNDMLEGNSETNLDQSKISSDSKKSNFIEKYENTLMNNNTQNKLNNVHDNLPELNVPEIISVDNSKLQMHSQQNSEYDISSENNFKNIEIDCGTNSQSVNSDLYEHTSENKLNESAINISNDNSESSTCNSENKHDSDSITQNNLSQNKIENVSSSDYIKNEDLHKNISEDKCPLKNKLSSLESSLELSSNINLPHLTNIEENHNFIIDNNNQNSFQNETEQICFMNSDIIFNKKTKDILEVESSDTDTTKIISSSDNVTNTTTIQESNECTVVETEDNFQNFTDCVTSSDSIQNDISKDTETIFVQNCKSDMPVCSQSITNENEKTQNTIDNEILSELLLSKHESFISKQENIEIAVGSTSESFNNTYEISEVNNDISLDSLENVHNSSDNNTIVSTEVNFKIDESENSNINQANQIVDCTIIQEIDNQKSNNIENISENVECTLNTLNKTLENVSDDTNIDLNIHKAIKDNDEFEKETIKHLDLPNETQKELIDNTLNTDDDNVKSQTVNTDISKYILSETNDSGNKINIGNSNTFEENLNISNKLIQNSIIGNAAGSMHLSPENNVQTRSENTFNVPNSNISDSTVNCDFNLNEKFVKNETDCSEINDELELKQDSTEIKQYCDKSIDKSLLKSDIFTKQSDFVQNKIHDEFSDIHNEADKCVKTFESSPSVYKNNQPSISTVAMKNDNNFEKNETLQVTVQEHNITPSVHKENQPSISTVAMKNDNNFEKNETLQETVQEHNITPSVHKENQPSTSTVAMKDDNNFEKNETLQETVQEHNKTPSVHKENQPSTSIVPMKDDNNFEKNETLQETVQEHEAVISSTNISKDVGCDKKNLEKVFEEFVQKTEANESDEQFVSGDLFKNPEDFDIFFKVSSKSHKNKILDKRQSKLSLLKQFDPYFQRQSVAPKPFNENNSEFTSNLDHKSVAEHNAGVVQKLEVGIKDLKNESQVEEKTIFQNISDNNVKIPQPNVLDIESEYVQMKNSVENLICEPRKMLSENINLDNNVKEILPLEKKTNTQSNLTSHDQKPLIETKSPAKIDNIKSESEINKTNSNNPPFLNIDERIRNKKLQSNCKQANVKQSENQCLQVQTSTLYNQDKNKSPSTKLIDPTMTETINDNNEPALISHKVLSKPQVSDTEVLTNKNFELNQLENIPKCSGSKIDNHSQKRSKILNQDLDTAEGRIIYEIQSMILSNTGSKDLQIMKLNKLKEHLSDQFNYYNAKVEKLSKNSSDEKYIECELLQLQLKEAQDKIEKLTVIVSEFEGIVNELIASNQVLKSERDTALTHLASAESAFSDVHSKFERSKKIIEEMQYNENVLKVAYEDLRKALDISEQKYIAFKKHVVEQINMVNKQVTEKRTNYEAEILRLQTSIRRLELHNQSLQCTLEQKTTEAKELENICDNLTNKLCGKALQ